MGPFSDNRHQAFFILGERGGGVKTIRVLFHCDHCLVLVAYMRVFKDSRERSSS